MEKSKSTDNVSRLTSGKLLARNTIFNLLGHIIPLSVAFFAYPVLINSLGADRFGVLTLIWIVIGYFTLFDFGLGRALTKLVAERLAKVKEGEIDREITSLIWTCLLVMLVFGIVAAIILEVISPWLVNSMLKIPDIYKPETRSAFIVLALSIPVVISTTSLRGILEAQQKFAIINILRIIYGIYTFLGPIVILQFYNSLFAIAIVLALGRLVFWLVYFIINLYSLPQLRHDISIKLSLVAPLLRLGGWMAVSNIVAPIIGTADRFIIGSWLTIAAVAYYSTPYEVVTKLLIIPNAVIKVLFPAFATSFAHAPENVLGLYNRSIKYIFIIVFPMIVLIVSFANIGLKLWLNDEFAMYGTRVMQWMALGVLTNSLAQVAFVAIQALGRPDLTAKLHFYQSVPYLFFLWLMVKVFGLEGAAITWMVRVVAEGFILFYILSKLLNNNLPYHKRADLFLIPAIAVLIPAFFLKGILFGGIYCFVILTVFALITWFWLLESDEHEMVKNYIKKVKHFNE